MWKVPLMALAVLFTTTLVVGQEPPKKEEPAAATAGRGSLPPNFKRLDLSEEQKLKIQTLRGSYRSKIAELEHQLHQLRDQERSEIADVLTDAQKAKLRSISLERAPKEKETTGEKKQP